MSVLRAALLPAFVAFLVPAGPSLAAAAQHDVNVDELARDVDLLTAPFVMTDIAKTSIPVALGDEDAVAKLAADALVSHVAEAVRTHPEAQAAVERGAESGYAVRAAQADLYPKVDMGVDLLGNWTNRTPLGGSQQHIPSQTLYRPDAYASVEQLLFDAGATFARIAAARHRMDASIADAEVAATAVAVRAIAAYWDVLRLREAVELAEANVAAHAVLLERVSVRVEAGAASEGDRLRAESRTNSARSHAFVVKGALSRAAAEYAAVYGAPPAATLAWPTITPHLGDDVDGVLARALVLNPELDARESGVEAARKDAAADRARYWPTVSLAANARQYDVLDRDQRLYDAGAQLIVRYRLFSGGAKSAESAQSRSRLRQAELVRDVERRELESEVRAAMSDVTTRDLEFGASLRTAETSQQTYAVYVEQYGVGRRGLDDLLDALNEAYLAAGQLLQARVDVDVARYALLARTGDLLGLINAAPVSGKP